MIEWLKNITIRKFWFLKLIWNKSDSYLYQTGWIKSFKKRQPVDCNGNEIPWLSLTCIHFLDARINNSMRVFEYGSGNSTFWFSKRAKEVISVEHDEAWYHHIKNKLVSANVRLMYSDVESEYINKSSAFGYRFHIIIVDGRKRVESCLAASANLTSDGVLIFDDTQREKYFPATKLMNDKGFKRIDFFGMSAGSIDFKCTTIFYKENNCLGI